MAEDSQSLGGRVPASQAVRTLWPGIPVLSLPPSLPPHPWAPSVPLRDPSWFLCSSLSPRPPLGSGCSQQHSSLCPGLPSPPSPQPSSRTAASRIHLTPPSRLASAGSPPAPFISPFPLLERPPPGPGCSRSHTVLSIHGQPSLVLRPDLLPRLRSLPGSEPALLQPLGPSFSLVPLIQLRKGLPFLENPQWASVHSPCLVLPGHPLARLAVPLCSIAQTALLRSLL